MSNKQPKDSDPVQQFPVDDIDLSINATHLVSDTPPSKHAALVEKLNVKPGEQRRVALGSFTKKNPAKGFSVELSPDPNPTGSLVTEVTSMGTSKQYKLALHIANYGASAVAVKVWSL